jgi:hypothetical protein
LLSNIMLLDVLKGLGNALVDLAFEERVVAEMYE